MPYIQVSLSEKLDAQKTDTLKTMFGEKIELLPGKSESVLMVRIDDARTMYFRGLPGQCAMIEVHLYKDSPKEAKSAFASAVLGAFSELTGVPIDQIFMNFTEYTDWASRGVLR